MHVAFWWGSLRDGDHVEDPDLHWRIILKWISEKWSSKMGERTGLIWLGMETGGGFQ